MPVLESPSKHHEREFPPSNQSFLPSHYPQEKPRELTNGLQQQLARKQQAMAAANFPYDLQACRQYQSRGAAAVPAIRSNSSSMAGPSPGYAVPTSSVMNNGAGMYQHQHAGSFPYEWAPGVSTAATGFSAEGGSTTAGAMGYSMCPQAYHGMPSPDEPYLVGLLITDTFYGERQSSLLSTGRERHDGATGDIKHG